MTTDRRDFDDILLNQLLEFILEAPEDEFLQYVIDCGDDPIKLGREGRDAILAALKRHGKSKLQNARQQHQQRKATIEELRRSVPSTFRDKQSMLAALLKKAQLSGKQVSFQNRLLKDASPEDVDSAIAELLVLLRNESG
jgi:hypothetical protein